MCNWIKFGTKENCTFWCVKAIDRIKRIAATDSNNFISYNYKNIDAYDELKIFLLVA